MSAKPWSGEEELVDRLAVVSLAARTFVGVDRYEHLLVDLLALLSSGRVRREFASRTLIDLIEPWPGAPEVLEFCMRSLRWPEVREALSAQVEGGADSRMRESAASVLRAYEESWPDGDIYRTYRSN